MFGPNILANYDELAAIVLFAIGFCMLLLHPNIIKKIMGLNIVDTAIYLYLTSIGYIAGRTTPIISDPSAAVNAADYINPLPAGLVLTGIVVSVSVTAVMLALALRLYKKYHTLNIDEIYLASKGEREEGDAE